VPAYELIVPNPVAGNFEVVVPGHFGSAARRASHIPSSAALTSDEGKADPSAIPQSTSAKPAKVSSKISASPDTKKADAAD